MAFEGLDFIEVFRGKQSFNFIQPQTQFAIEENLLQEINFRLRVHPIAVVGGSRGLSKPIWS